jgi:hypothetical protein
VAELSDSTPGKQPVRAVSSTRDVARQAYFISSEAREDLFRVEQERERKASDGQAEALRLSKEQSRRIAAANAPPVKKTVRKR